MRAMAPQSETERRHASDRRRFARGGRRPGDRTGFAPLVLVADDDPGNGAHCEAILAARAFAVAPAHSVEEAVRVMRVLHPDVIVSHLRENGRLRDEVRADDYGAHLPLITFDDGAVDPEGLIDEIRRELRARATLPFPSSDRTTGIQYHSGSH